MSYTSAETALDTIIKLVTGYSATNVSKGDYRILGTGQMKAVVLMPGAFSRENMAPGQAANRWGINIELFIAFTDEISTIASSIRTERQNIIDKIDKYPTLNRATGIMLGEINSGDEPEIWAVGSRKYWRQVMRVQVKEITTVTYAE